MITELYQDKGIIKRDGEDVRYVNSTHLWWVRFSNGATRPAEETEIELWQLAMGYKDNYEGACRDFWNTYAAAMGVDEKTFAGIKTENPVEDVRQHRRSLEHRIEELETALSGIRPVNT